MSLDLCDCLYKVGYLKTSKSTYMVFFNVANKRFYVGMNNYGNSSFDTTLDIEKVSGTLERVPIELTTGDLLAICRTEHDTIIGVSSFCEWWEESEARVMQIPRIQMSIPKWNDEYKSTKYSKLYSKLHSGDIAKQKYTQKRQAEISKLPLVKGVSVLEYMTNIDAWEEEVASIKKQTEVFLKRSLPMGYSNIQRIEYLQNLLDIERKKYPAPYLSWDYCMAVYEACIVERFPVIIKRDVITTANVQAHSLCNYGGIAPSKLADDAVFASNVLYRHVATTGTPELEDEQAILRFSFGCITFGEMKVSSELSLSWLSNDILDLSEVETTSSTGITIENCPYLKTVILPTTPIRKLTVRYNKEPEIVNLLSCDSFNITDCKDGDAST